MVTVTVANADEQTDALISQAKGGLQNCKQLYVANEVYSVVSARNKAIAEQLRLSQQELGIPTNPTESGAEPNPYDYRTCIAKETSELVVDGKRYISNPKNRKRASEVKVLVAQWMTAMDAIPKGNADEEESRFETLANKLSLGM